MNLDLQGIVLSFAGLADNAPTPKQRWITPIRQFLTISYILLSIPQEHQRILILVKVITRFPVLSTAPIRTATAFIVLDKNAFLMEWI